MTADAFVMNTSFSSISTPELCRKCLSFETPQVCTGNRPQHAGNVFRAGSELQWSRPSCNLRINIRRIWGWEVKCNTWSDELNHQSCTKRLVSIDNLIWWSIDLRLDEASRWSSQVYIISWNQEYVCLYESQHDDGLAVLFTCDDRDDGRYQWIMAGLI